MTTDANGSGPLAPDGTPMPQEMTAAEKAGELDALNRSVIDPDKVDATATRPTSDSLVLFLTPQTDGFTQWGRRPIQRDKELRDFWPTENYFASALGIVGIRNAGMSWSITGDEQTAEAAQELLNNANFGGGWEEFVVRLSIDLYTQDKGAFVELVRAADNPESPVIGINNLDAARCLGRDSRVCLGGDRLGKTKAIIEMVHDRDSGPVVAIGGDGSFVEREVTGWHTSSLRDRYWLRLVPTSTRQGARGSPEGLWLTNDHQVLTPDGWREAESLVPSSEIVTDWPALNPVQAEVLTGTLLGDASLFGKTKISMTLGHSAAQREWLETKRHALAGFRWSEPRGGSFVQTNSKATPSLIEWREAWYPDGDKHVPRDLVERHFSPRMLATWYADDGTRHHTRWGRDRAYLFTYGFTESDTRWLVSLLVQHGIDARPSRKRITSGPYAGREYLGIYLTADGAETLFSIVAPYLPPSVRHKIPEGLADYDPALWDCGTAVPFVDTVASIKRGDNGGQATAYCLDVEGDHNFSVGGMIVHNCFPTGDPERPVIYEDRLGKFHLMKWYQVVQLLEMPAPRTPSNTGFFWKIQYSALTRMLRAVQVLKSVTIYKDEKISGRFHRGVHLLQGVSADAVQDAMNKATVISDNEGLTRYAQPVMVGSVDVDADIGVETLDLASLPDSFDEEQTIKDYITIIAMAFATDYQEFAPLPTSGGLGNSRQAEVLHMKTRGKGPAMFQGLLTRLINLNGVIPNTVEFSFDEQDLDAETIEADNAKTRAEERSIRILSGELTVDAARQRALDEGDLSIENFEAMDGTDLTPDVTIEGEDATEVSGLRTVTPLDPVPEGPWVLDFNDAPWPGPVHRMADGSFETGVHSSGYDAKVTLIAEKQEPERRTPDEERLEFEEEAAEDIDNGLVAARRLINRRLREEARD